MHDGSAILGIFLATYSSKGDYLPLRYPLSRSDVEYTERLLKESRGQKRAARAVRGGGGGPAAEAAAASAADERVPAADSSPGQADPPAKDSAKAEGPAPAPPPLQPRTSGRREAKPARSGADAGEDGSQEPYLERKVHGFEAKFLAQLFSPRPSMSDRRFQVAIDNVLFVGHPLRDDPKEKTRDPDYYDTEQDDTEAVSRLAEYGGWKVRPDTVAEPGANRRTRLLADLGLMGLMLNREPSEAGDSAISDGERAVRDSHEWRRRGYWNRVYPKLFHIVFMLDNTVPGIEALADRIYDHVLRRLTKTLMIEQTESNYVLTQSRLIRILNDQALAERFSPARYLQEVLTRAKLAADLIELYNGLRKDELVCLHIHDRMKLSLQIPRGPHLDRPLPPTRHRTFFGAGRGPDGASLSEVSARPSAAHTPRPRSPPDGYPPTTPAGSAAPTRSVAAAVQDYDGPVALTYDGRRKGGCGAAHSLPITVAIGRELQPGEYDGYPHIEPFHAILLLEDTETLLRRLMHSDVSPTLLALIEKALPSRPLATLHTMVDCSYAQMCRFVSHLVYWNVARLICPVVLSFTYVPTAAGLAPSLVDGFNARGFSLCTLPQLLAQMHPPRPANQVLDALVAGTASPDLEYDGDPHALKTEFRGMLVYLLRAGAIAQYHTWPVVLVPSYVKHDVSEEQFVHLAFGWFRTLHAEHPDLLGAFPRALLNLDELECWAVAESREQEEVERVHEIAREAESRVMLCRIMRRLALHRIRESSAAKQLGKRSSELAALERQAADEEARVHTFCNRLERDSMDQWIHSKAQYDAALAQARRSRAEERRARGRDLSDDTAAAASRQSLHRWYDFVKADPDLAEFAHEIVSKHVHYVPTDAPPRCTNAERRYLRQLARRGPPNQQDWFLRHSHLFTGENHLVKLADSEQIPTARLEDILREFGGVVHLPQHI
ncbi:Nitrogen permease regulator 3 [Coemansia helicoidea]|uniref:Nitrogen permease regulator 3 n=1 Tax=Coemansia helicoidea TaxID=1286919 RepID=A0ACC1L8T4_9FUNG|nr:Nitrogen permease regulator 3 [Coemansia helicoidea]